MITFDRQAGPLQNFNRSHYHGHRKKCIVFRPRATPGWGRGAPQAPQNPPPPPKNTFFCMRFRTPGTFLKKNLVEEHFLAEIFFSVKNFNSPPPPPPPHMHAPTQSSEHSPQSSCNNKKSQQLQYDI